LAQSGLREVDGAEVTCLVDNVVDPLLMSTEVVRRFRGEAPPEMAPLMGPGEIRMTMRAENPYSALITSVCGVRTDSLLLDALREIDPQVIVPAHCTGWKAVHAFAAAMPQAFVQNCVGTRYVF
jgi:hypothetical protein